MSPDQQEEIIADMCSNPALKFSQREAVRRLLQERNTLRKAAQPVATVAQVPAEVSCSDDAGDYSKAYADGWNDCRNAMLAASPAAATKGDA